MQALIGGSVDVVTGAYEHTIRMQAKGQDVLAVTELGRFPAIVIAVKKDKAGKVKSAADFKGLKIGVTAPGSSTALTAQYAMVKAGPEGDRRRDHRRRRGRERGRGDEEGRDRRHLASRPGHRQARSGRRYPDPDRHPHRGRHPGALRRLEPGGVLYAKKDFIEKNPETMQRLVNAFVKSLKWLQTAKPEDVADTVPAEYHLGDKPLYLKAVQNSLESYSRDRHRPRRSGMESVLDMLKQLDPELKDAKVDLAATFDDRFVRKAVG